MAKPKKKDGRLCVFKGREAKLNRAIFQSLALKGAQTIYDIHKHVRTFRGLKYTYYGNVNKRVRALQQARAILCCQWFIRQKILQLWARDLSTAILPHKRRLLDVQRKLGDWHPLARASSSLSFTGKHFSACVSHDLFTVELGLPP